MPARQCIRGEMGSVIETSLSFAKRLALNLAGGPTIEIAQGGDLAGSIFRMVEEAYEENAPERKELQKLRDFYDGHALIGRGLNEGEYYVSDWPDETPAELQVRLTRMESTKWNRFREGINAHADALYAWGRGRAVNRSIRWDEESGVSDADRQWFERHFARKFVVRNGLAHFIWDTWRIVGAERRALVMSMWMDASARRLRRFSATAGRAEMKRNGVVWLSREDNTRCIPLPHPEQDRTLGAVIRWYERPTTARRGPVSPPHPGHSDTVTELITDELWIRWRGKTLELHQWGVSNRYRDVRNLFTWFRNPGDVSDGEDAMGSQTLLNEHMYNAREISREHAFPETLYVGFSPPTREVDGKRVLVRAPNLAYTSDDPKADIKKKGPDAGFQDIGIREDQIHQMLDGALGLSVTDRGSGKDLGQLRSGPAMSRLQSRSERRRARKIMTAMDAEQELFQAVRNVTVYHAFGPDRVPGWYGSRIVVTFPEDAFTQDPFTEAQTDSVELGTGMAQIIDKLRKRFPDLTDEELEEKARETIEELKEVSGAEDDLNDPEPTPAARAEAQAANAQ